MSRAETIAIITSKLASLDDERLRVIAELVQDTESVMPRELSERERALLEQSKADFRDGRTYTLDEARSYVDAALAERRAKSTKP